MTRAPGGLRVLLVSRAMPEHQLGGLERHARDVALGLISRGHQVEVWTTSLPEGAAPANDVATRYLGGAPGSHSETFRQGVLDALQDCREPFDLLLSESTSAAYAMARLRPPRRPPVAAVLHGTSLSEALSVIAADHGLGKWPRVLLRTWPRHLALVREERAAYCGAERLVCVSEYVAAQARRLYGVPAGRVSVVRNGIPLPPAPTPEQRRAAKEQVGAGEGLMLLCLGRLARDKGFDLAIEAFARSGAPGRLYVVGGGPEEERLKALAGGSPQVVFTGPVAREGVEPYLLAADALLLPSVRYEGHPYVLVEAAAAGLAVVASDRGGLGSEMRGRDIGLLVRPGDARGLADAIGRLCADEALRRSLGERLRAHAEKHYSLDAMLDGLESALAQAIPNCRR